MAGAQCRTRWLGLQHAATFLRLPDRFRFCRKGGLCGEGDTGNVTAFCGSLMRFLVRYCLLLLAASQQHACPTQAERQQ